MAAKFKVGDKVRFTGHELKIATGKSAKPRHSYLKAGIEYAPNTNQLKIVNRNYPRTIAKITYDSKRQRALYYLRAHGRLATVPFDSTQLTAETAPKPGRPRQKRAYHFIKHR